jgi:hypothetical protein
MSIDDKIKNDDLINPRCLFNNELRYRMRPNDFKDVGEQYCLLADDLCPYYKADKHKDLCMNYETRFK